VILPRVWVALFLAGAKLPIKEDAAKKGRI